MNNVLIVGATRGLGESLAKQYAKHGTTVYATARYSVPQNSSNIHWISNIDVAYENAGPRISAQWGEGNIDLMFICANYFATETFEDLHWDKEIAMYKTNSMGPLFLIQHLVKAGLLSNGSRIVLVGSEKGSISLRQESEGAENFGGHASKAALNMIGKLLSIKLKSKGVGVAIVHTGYLRAQRKDGSFEEPGDRHAVKPDEAASALVNWIQTFDISKTGQFWAVRGAGDIKTAEAVIGPLDTLPTPLQLPW
ncbi:NAD(P)-binding protein [Delitschia confertaspora ATCC 74209]|uniref:NAD(P)-binding protein n=1 Tax=Delitschia confertaspora ATCC 74209 TaxID=1513339 RepID=A0A9P4JNV5_9PLEO|nr:NAD(P)-binding protein [Delitschia confertaspora ATCC 74209]